MSNRTARAALLAAASLGAVVWWAAPSGAKVSPQAEVELVNAAGTSIGTVRFLGRNGAATEVKVDLDLPSGAPNLGAFHGLHIHATGSCVAPAFTSAGGHWDDGSNVHGAHLGDLPSVLVGPDGHAELDAAIPRFDVDDIVGRAIVLHAGRDNFGNVPVGAADDQYTANAADAVTATNSTGNAGARYGCGVIETPAG